MAFAAADALTEQERPFYQAVLRAFPELGGPPGPTWLAQEAAARGLDAGLILARLAELDCIVRDEATGAIISAYPFSGVPTPHRVEVMGGRPVYAMCAVDALGIPYMLGRDAIITSVDATSGTPIRVEVRGGVARWVPGEAAVLVGLLEDAAGPKAQTACPLVNFFASAEAAEAYRTAHPEVSGQVLSQEEAVEHGKRFFGDLLVARP